MTNSVNSYGQINWEDDVYAGVDKKNNSKDLFLRLDEGTNELRLVTQPYQYLVHKVKKDPTNPKDFGQKVSCSMVHGSCPLCAQGDKPKPRWFLGVISRKTGTYKILDISFAVFSQIRKLARNTLRWGDPTKYDMDIVVDKNGGATGYYSVQPLGKDPLSAADQQIKDNLDLDDLKRRATPPTADLVQKRIDKITGVDTSASTAPAMMVEPKKTLVPANGVPAPSPAVTLQPTDDMEDVFPSYDAHVQAN